MYRPTGEGKWEAILDLEYAGIVEALLYNFDFDDFYEYKFRPLKTEHKNFLKDHVIPALAKEYGYVWMRGSASRIGTADWNMELSRNRVMRVAGFLMENGIDAEKIETNAIGNRRAMEHALDDERDRGVFLFVYPKFEFHPEPKRQIPQKKAVSTRFKIAGLTSISKGLEVKAFKYLGHLIKAVGKLDIVIGPTADVNFFIIWDTTNNLSCLYLYVGVGVSIGVDTHIPVGSTIKGDWTAFTTKAPIFVSQFGPTASLFQAGLSSGASPIALLIGDLLNWSTNRLTIDAPPPVRDVTVEVDLADIVSDTVGNAATSTTHGKFIRLEGPAPFHGP
jgi:hypothetical protein